MLGALEDRPAIGALTLEHAARIMQPVGQHMDVGVAPWHQLAIVPDDAIDFIERNSHWAFSRIDADRAPAPRRCWLRLGPRLHQPHSRFPSSHVRGHAFVVGGSPVLLPIYRSTIVR